MLRRTPSLAQLANGLGTAKGSADEWADYLGQCELVSWGMAQVSRVQRMFMWAC